MIKLYGKEKERKTVYVCVREFVSIRNIFYIVIFSFFWNYNKKIYFVQNGPKK